MDKSTLRVLEYEEIRRRLAERAACSLGRELVAAMAPSSAADEVARLQSETAAAARLASGPGIPLGGLSDVRPLVGRAGLGSTLSGPELLAAAIAVESLERLRAHLLLHEESAGPLAEEVRAIPPLGPLALILLSALGEEGELRDNASPKLARLRGEARSAARRIGERAQSIARDPAMRDMIQSPVVTTRDGRFCLQVKSEYRTQFGGLVHGSSGTGATLFMEPAPLVELGNVLRQTEAEIADEEERILRDLSARLGAQSAPLIEGFAAAGRIDFINARAATGLDLGWQPADPSAGADLSLVQARHPLLEPPVVPLDLELTREQRVMVITGPNTGGKTVAMKTAGLLALMHQSGCWIPASPSSRLPVFTAVLADIGDEQSIQQSLSTFSGHIRRIAHILQTIDGAKAPVLVLLDEMGAGTDPEEGSALACALLEHLLSRGVLAIVTSHYSDLKEVAYRSDGALNASVEFDAESLKPTYRLLAGVPGSSNALAIASRLGLSPAVIEAARQRLGEERLEAGRLIESLIRDTRQAEERLRVARDAAEEAEAGRKQAAEELIRLRSEHSKTLARTRQEAEEILRTARREADAVGKDLRRLQRKAEEGAREAAPAELERLREGTRRAGRRLEHAANLTEKQVRRIEREAPPPVEPAAAGPPPQVGDEVWIARWQREGKVLSLEPGAQAVVQTGAMRVTLPLHELSRRPAQPSAGRPARSSTAEMQQRARLEIAPELHLRGLRAEEALIRLEAYLDDACLAGVPSVRIVHGKGEGILRRLIAEQLRRHPSVESHHHPAPEEGGEGVTVVVLEA